MRILNVYLNGAVVIRAKEEAGPLMELVLRGSKVASKEGIRVNCVAPGPIWTPLIPSTFPPEKVKAFRKDVALGRPGQPAELAAVFVLLASDDASYIAAATIAVMGGNPLI